jgi:5-(carboxyamino)imidazole ribonucleotide synthase
VNIGILGGGQLGRMLALAGYPLGHRFVFLDPAPEALGGIGDHVVAPPDDPRALAELAARVDVVTYEFENVPVSAARAQAARVAVFPPPEALEVSQDRLVEKALFARLGVPTAPFAAVDSPATLERAVAEIGLPAVLKTRRLGYDGKGQAVLGTRDEIEAAWSRLGGAPCIVEGFVRFTRELSLLAARGRDGAATCYPLAENRHEGGILRRSLAPAPGVAPALAGQAEGFARALLEHLGYVGVLALELFEVDGRLLANEMAPRVHNSGHWTIEGAETSQFENHVRAVTGAPLGSTVALGYAAMLNLIGSWPEPSTILAVPGAHLHLYGKAPRPGRKTGHVTIRCDDPVTLRERVAVVEDLIAS